MGSDLGPALESGRNRASYGLKNRGQRSGGRGSPIVQDSRERAWGLIGANGLLTATTLVLEPGDLSRFRNSKAVASHARLVPRVADSADKGHHGRITKRGTRELC